jgi:hypothetical protein
VIEGDARQVSDTELFEQLLDGRVRENDPRVGDLFHRRPQWRELSELSRSPSEEERTAAWGENASEDDRRLVAECFADARARGADVARLDGSSRVIEAPATKRWPRLLFALAALVVVTWLAWMWWAADHGPRRKRGELLHTSPSVDSNASGDTIEEGDVAPDFSWFSWRVKGPTSASEQFHLQVWAVDPSGERGARLFSSNETSKTRYEIPREDRSRFSNEVIWRVDRIDSSGGSTLGRERRAQRTMR